MNYFILCINYNAIYRQERLIEARYLNEQVPEIVIEYYEKKIKFSNQIVNHYIIDNKQVI